MTEQQQQQQQLRRSKFCTWRQMLWMVTTLLVSFTPQVSAQCGLCGSVSEFPSQFSKFVPAVGKTCKDIYIDLSATPLGDSCNSMRSLAAGPCCDDAPSTTSNQPARPNPNYVYPGPFGNEPTCQLCGTAEYPGKPFQFIVARYIGEYNCDQLYYRGLNGLIDPTLCGPLKDFAESICGCGDFNPACDPTKPASETFCYDPNNPNQPFPTPRPTQRPTNRPTNRPTTGGLDFGSFSAEDFAQFQAFLEFIASVDFSSLLDGFFSASSVGGGRNLQSALRGASEQQPPTVRSPPSLRNNEPPLFSTRSSESSQNQVPSESS